MRDFEDSDSKYGGDYTYYLYITLESSDNIDLACGATKAETFGNGHNPERKSRIFQL